MIKDIAFRLAFNAGKWAKNFLGLLSACVACYEHIVLAVALVVTYLGGCLFALLWLDVDNCWGWTAGHMFDFASVKGSIMRGGVSEKICAFSLYCITWLIGGGTLLAALVSRSGAFLAKIRNGEMRYTWCLRGHHIILGWDYNVISLLRQTELRRKQVVIISEIPAVEIRKTVRMAVGVGRFSRLPFQLLLYCGQCDSKSEFKKIALKHAARVYITGVQQEKAHDVRTLILLSHIDNYLGEINVKIPFFVRIQSHYLYRLLILNIKKGSNGFQHLGKDVRFFNFYENWARRLWDNEARNENKKQYPLLRYLPINNKSSIRLVVVGFGQMGQALVVQALRQAKVQSEENKDGVKTSITIIDPMANQLYEHFLQNYGDIVDGYKKDCEIKEVVEMSAHSLEFKRKLSELGYCGEQVTIAITLPDADEALNSAMMINDAIRQRANILVRANIYNSDVEMCRKDLANCYDLKNIYFFGFKDGAGFKR